MTKKTREDFNLGYKKNALSDKVNCFDKEDEAKIELV